MDRSSVAEIDLGIVSALPVESAAVRLFVDDLVALPTPQDPNLYHVGRIPSRNPARPHRVVVAVQARDGTRNAAALCTDLARSFPSLRAIVLSGIAAGIPTPGTAAVPDRYPAGSPEPSLRAQDVAVPGPPRIRLGDVISATDGVVDYDHVRTVDGQDSLRRPTEGLSKALLRADRAIEIREYHGDHFWLHLLDGRDRPVPAHFARPTNGRPTVHRGAIGSADRLLRDARKRDDLATRYKIRAIEMEASGLAVGADLHNLHWYAVRGIADFADSRKDDRWHAYAALTAAAYTRALLTQCEPMAAGRADNQRTDANPPSTGFSTGLGRVVDALLDIGAMRDDYQRRAVLANLPTRIRAAIPDNPVARLHVIAMVRTCQEFPDGKAALIFALRLALGDLPRLAEVEAAIHEFWSA